ncbi:unnamed protein product [Phytophthora fragariaefolia]|uniref:Unnamed protein product n=1 Tax=Phytophthora fragariaefolia TaxID=1490495 RepID=A0A9W6WS09_9STRA|nr:unnamed protein product [Phytophthora fragariaefolia]
MSKRTTSSRGLSPATVERSLRATIDLADSVDSAMMAAMDTTADKVRSIRFDGKLTRDHGNDEDDDGVNEDEKAEFANVKTTA